MSGISARAAGTSAVRRNGTSIIAQREIEPLLAKAREAAVFYGEAMNCSVTVRDRSGNVIETPPGTKSRARVCEVCGECHADTSGLLEDAELLSGPGTYPCAETHLDAIAKSRRAAGPYIYTCAAGFVYWTSPVFQRGTLNIQGKGQGTGGRFRNGRYAGALTAGQVLFSGAETAAESPDFFRENENALKKFRGIIDGIPKKTHEEIRAMASLLGVCAEEISGREEDSGKMIRRAAWREGNEAGPRKQQKIQARTNHRSPDEAGPEYPMDKERMLLAAFRRGDNETGEKILKELMNYIIAAMPGNFEIIRFRAIELIVLLSRAAAGTSDNDALLEANNRYIKRIQESKTTEELTENLYVIASRMAGQIFSFQGVRHASVLRKAERYIWKNYTRKISLTDISKAAGLSPPYFSSIFKEEMGENLSGYLNRLRVERAAALLAETGRSLSEIAGLCGFEDQSWFSKIFKKFTGTSPGKYRENSGGSPRM